MPSDSRIHIAHLIYRLGQGGAERQLVSLACALPRERFRQSFITAVPGGWRTEELKAAGVEVLCMPRRGALDPVYLHSLRSFLRRERPDVLNTRGISASLWWQVAAWLGPAGPPCVVTRSAYEVQATALTSLLSHWQLRLSAQVLANSEELAVHLEQQHPWLRGHIDVIHNGVDSARFSAPVDRASVLSAEGLDPALPLVLSVGRLHEVKNFELLLKAAALLQQQGLRANFAVAGDGPEHARLSRLIDELGLRGSFMLLPARERIEPLLQSCGVFVLSSRSESFNNSLLEALAAGRACVSTRVSGSDYQLDGGQHGTLVNTGDARAMAAAIRAYLEQPALAAEHGARAAVFVREKLNLQLSSARYAAVFERLAESTGRRG
ncbi:glycosyltransferase [bacterium]|nr:glycosyltransferase [bacterium]